MTTEEHHSFQMDLSAQPLTKPDVHDTIVSSSMPVYFSDLKKSRVFIRKSKRGNAIRQTKSASARDGL